MAEDKVIKKRIVKGNVYDEPTRMSFSYPREMKEQLQKYADRDSRSLSAYIQRVLKLHIEARKAKESKQ